MLASTMQTLRPHPRTLALLRRRRASTLVCPIVDLEGLGWYYRGAAPPEAAVAAVKESLASASIWRVVNHNFAAETYHRVKESGRAFFDQASVRKEILRVGDMDRSRGWEMYPQHYRYHLARLAERRRAFASAGGGEAEEEEEEEEEEPSSAEGILCERFVCGPPSICNRGDGSGRPYDPFYDSEFARVFYESNVWPPPRPQAATPAPLRGRCGAARRRGQGR